MIERRRDCFALYCGSRAGSAVLSGYDTHGHQRVPVVAASLLVVAALASCAGTHGTPPTNAPALVVVSDGGFRRLRCYPLQALRSGPSMSVTIQGHWFCSQHFTNSLSPTMDKEP